MRKIEGMMNYKVVYLKPIKMLYGLMVAVFTIPLHTWSWQQCVPATLNSMVYHTGNVCDVVVICAHVLSYPVRRQIKIQQAFFNNTFSCLPECITFYCAWTIYILITHNMLNVFHSA